MPCLNQNATYQATSSDQLCSLPLAQIPDALSVQVRFATHFPSLCSLPLTLVLVSLNRLLRSDGRASRHRARAAAARPGRRRAPPHEKFPNYQPGTLSTLTAHDSSWSTNLAVPPFLCTGGCRVHPSDAQLRGLCRRAPRLGPLRSELICRPRMASRGRVVLRRYACSHLHRTTALAAVDRNLCDCTRPQFQSAFKRLDVQSSMIIWNPCIDCWPPAHC